MRPGARLKPDGPPVTPSTARVTGRPMPSAWGLVVYPMSNARTRSQGRGPRPVIRTQPAATKINALNGIDDHVSQGFAQ